MTNEPTPDELYRRAKRRVFSGTLFLLVVFGVGICYSARRSRDRNEDQGRVFAVIPFRTSAPADAPLATGLADVLSADIASLPQTRLIPTNATLTGELPPSMGINFIISGDLERRPDGFRLVLKALDVAREREAIRPITVESPSLIELNRQVIQEMRKVLTPDPAPATSASVPEEAFRSYLTGRGHLAIRTEASLQRAVSDLQSALRVAPAFHEAQAALARAHAQLALERSDPEPDIAAAERHATAALLGNPSLLDALEAISLVELARDSSWERLLKTSAAVIRQAPGRDLVHLARAEALLHAGLFDLAVIECGMAKVSNPHLTPRCEVIEGGIQLYRGDAAAAASRLKKHFAALKGHDLVVYSRALLAAGDQTGAVRTLRAIAADAKNPASVEASALLDALGDRKMNTDAVVNPSHHALYALGVRAAAQRDDAEAVRLLSAAARQGFAPISLYENDPLLEDFRKRPGFSNVRGNVIEEVRRYQQLVAPPPPDQTP